MSGIGIKAPKFSRAKGEDFDLFKTQIDIQFQRNQITQDLDKVQTVILCLKGKAGRDIQSKTVIIKGDSTKKLVPDVWRNYKEFLESLREACNKYYDPQESAQQQIHRIKQGTSSIKTYITEFNKIAAYLLSEYKGDSNPVILFLFKNRLQTRILNTLLVILGVIN